MTICKRPLTAKKPQGFSASEWFIFKLEVPFFCQGGCRSNQHSCTPLWTSQCHCPGGWKLCSGSKAWNNRTHSFSLPPYCATGLFLVCSSGHTEGLASKPSPAQAGKAGCFAHLLCFIHRVPMSFLRLNPGSTWSPWAVCQLFSRQWGFYPLFILCRLG